MGFPPTSGVISHEISSRLLKSSIKDQLTTIQNPSAPSPGAAKAAKDGAEATKGMKPRAAWTERFMMSTMVSGRMECRLVVGWFVDCVWFVFIIFVY